MTSIVKYHNVGETKTNVVFCFVRFEDISVQILYYEQEGDCTVKLISNLDEISDSEKKDSFYDFFKIELQKGGVHFSLAENILEHIGMHF
jgi:hypothetical protein